MSFSYDVKSELCAVCEDNNEAKKAEIYGMLLFGHSFTFSGFLIQTEHAETLTKAKSLITALFDIVPKIKGSRVNERGHYSISAANEEDAYRVFSSFGYDRNTVSLRINRANMEDESAVSAFIRGAFLSCGTVVDPNRDYHLEFVIPYRNLSRDFYCLLKEYGMSPKITDRKGTHVVYFKGSEHIEDLITFMGATRQSLELMNIKVYKDIRNKANRLTNCETANIEKTVNASAMQIEAINRIIRKQGMESLPEELREVAELRLEYPEISLRELGELCVPTLSRSGVNHRMKKILELSYNDRYKRNDLRRK